MSTAGHRGRRPRVNEVVLAGAVALAAAAVALHPPVTGTGASWTVSALVLGAATVATAAVSRRVGAARAPTAWIAVTGVALLVLAVVESAVDRDPSLFGVEQRVLAVVMALLVPGLALTVPTGRLDHRVDRVVGGVVAVCGLAIVVAPVEVVALPASVLLSVATVAGVWARFERARDVERERILWVLLGTGGAVVVGGHLLFAAEQFVGTAPEIVLTTATLLCALAVPASLGVALLAPRAADVRRAISGLAVVVVMVDLALGVFAGTLALVEVVTGRPPSRSVASLVCVVVAAGFHPALVRVRETLDQVLFGGRPDPVGVVTTLGDEFRRGGGPQQWLDALCTAAELTYAELRHGDEAIAVSGRAAGPSATIALHAGTDHVGDLVVGLPEHHHELPRGTDAVLRLVAGPLARALQSARLAEEVQRSRRQVVLAAEEERRRLRRDLHDGLGPVLAGVAYTADAARNVVAARPERATELLAELRGDVAGAIGEVRRLVHDLRPPVLDQLGLVAALHQQADRITQDTGGPTVTVDAEAVGTLPAAVEVAAYRVVVEAVLNVVRHAGASHARVSLRRDPDALALVVADDGTSGVAWTPGVGLTSMRERLEHLGGVLEAGATPDGGRVSARIPVREGSAPGTDERGDEGGADDEVDRDQGDLRDRRGADGHHRDHRGGDDHHREADPEAGAVPRHPLQARQDRPAEEAGDDGDEQGRRDVDGAGAAGGEIGDDVVRAGGRAEQPGAEGRGRGDADTEGAGAAAAGGRGGGGGGDGGGGEGGHGVLRGVRAGGGAG